MNSKTLTLPGRFEKANTVLRHMVSNDDLGREQNSAEKLQAKYDAMTPALMAKLAKSAIKPEAMVWVVIGDLSKVEANIRKLKLGDVEIWDEKGNKLK